jgi:ABC-type oligopeptide transport system substrate-binding subunit
MSWPDDFWPKYYIPSLDNPIENHDWDISLHSYQDWYGHFGATFLRWGLAERSEMRWIEYDPVYEEMWKDMTRTVDEEKQEEKIGQMGKFVFDKAHQLPIFSPLTLYAVNNDVNFVPQKELWLRPKETSETENHWSITIKKNDSRHPRIFWVSPHDTCTKYKIVI